MKFLVILALALVAVNAAPQPKLPPFMDCPGDEPFTPDERICCTHETLPNGCECFDISSNSDFTNSHGKLPQCPPALGVQFFLFTRANSTVPSIISSVDDSIDESDFDSSRPTKFIIHGFTDWAPGPWNVAMKDNILDVDDANVILVNWHKGAVGINYNFWQAAVNIRPTAAVVAQLIHVLKESHGVNLQDVHLIGHSMGGQVVGTTGKEVERLEDEKLGRISGLDACGPGFETYSANVCLDKSDATFVDLIHTDTERPGLGMKHAAGHVDFFPNGAVAMPGCPARPISFEAMMRFEDGTFEAVCSHEHAFKYYTASIQDCQFIAPGDDAKCAMGYHVTAECSGEHHPTTTAEKPFC